MSTNIRVLYIDDDQINIELFEIVFSEKFEIQTGISGNEGLKILDSNPAIDVIVSDMKMPGMSGLEFIIKAREKYPNKKYFILTGYGINSEIQKAIDAHIILDCFAKPFNNQLIERSIQECVGC